MKKREETNKHEKGLMNKNFGIELRKGEKQKTKQKNN